MTTIDTPASDAQLGAHIRSLHAQHQTISDKRTELAARMHADQTTLHRLDQQLTEITAELIAIVRPTPSPTTP